MRIVHTFSEARRAISELRADGRRVALVPTMGALHDGHLSLVARGAEDDHAVVMTIFVNPTQFGEGEDLEAYPRDLERDAALAAEAGVELLIAPRPDEVYPDGFATTVSVGGPALGLEGASRPGHFDGVATVVSKLLWATRPDRAVFGRKDAQQVAVIRRAMLDLHLDDIELVVAPTVREADGLAMSSRNAYLSADERATATVLHRALLEAGRLAADGETDAQRLISAAHEVLAGEAGCEVEYVAVVDPRTFEELTVLDRPGLVCVAARVGPARLIDNIELSAPARPSNGRTSVSPSTRTMLKSKIHRATVTDADLNYVGSITVDTDLLDAADIRPYEQVAVVNINNGARFETYTIEGARGTGTMCLNGAAARLAQPGDLIIVLSYATFPEAELDGYEPTVVHVDAENRRMELSDAVLAGIQEHDPSD